MARAHLIRRVVGFALAFGLTIFLALDGGGFDVVVRDVVGIGVWAAIALGFATGFFPRGRFSRGAWIALGGLGVLTALTAVAHSWTESDEATTLELARVVQYLGIVTLAYLALDRDTWHRRRLGSQARRWSSPSSRLAPGSSRTCSSTMSPEPFTSTASAIRSTTGTPCRAGAPWRSPSDSASALTVPGCCERRLWPRSRLRACRSI